MKKLFASIKPLDFVIVFFVLFTGIFLIISKSNQKGNLVIAQANGKTYEFDGTKDGFYSVQGILGETTFEVKNGKIRITSSPCPNKTCIEQHWSSPLVCLPNKVIITIENTGEFDAISE